MRSLFALILVCAAGCGDDTSTGTSLDMSVAQDLASGGPTCAAYCAKIAMTCTNSGDAGGHDQYAGAVATCANYCSMVAGWSSGMMGDTSGNTIGCRLYHAGAAASDPTTHCPHAGPTGGNVCGSWCDNYCQLMAKNCTGANAVYDAATCMTKCTSIPTSGMPNDQSGNTIQCRIYHLGAAFSNPTLHCPHAKTAADLPGGPCT